MKKHYKEAQYESEDTVVELQTTIDVDDVAYFAIDDDYTYVLGTPDNIAEILEQAPENTVLLVKKTYKTPASKLQQKFRFLDQNSIFEDDKILSCKQHIEYNRTKRPKKSKRSKIYSIFDMIDLEDIDYSYEDTLKLSTPKK